MGVEAKDIILAERYRNNLGTFSPEELSGIMEKSACIVGLGGLGGHACQTLARFGIGSLTLIDGDVFEESNLNRQVFSTEDNLGVNKALAAAAGAIDRDRSVILAANSRDVEQARKSGMKESLVDRLLLNDKRIDGLIEGINIVIKQEDPIGKVQIGWTLPNGLQIEKVTVPMGVAAIIYESRPNVTADCAALAYKSGCSILLRGSSSALESNKALVRSIKTGLAEGGGIADAVALAESGSRDEVDVILNKQPGIRLLKYLRVVFLHPDHTVNTVYV